VDRTHRDARRPCGKAGRAALGRTMAGLLATAALALGPAAPARAQLFPNNFQAMDIAPTATFVDPVGLAFAPDGRIFVAEKRGQVQILESAGGSPPTYTRRAMPFLDLGAEVLDNADRGMLGIALDPYYATNGYLYLAYSVETDPGTPDLDQLGFLRIVRYTRSTANPYIADPASRLVLVGETWPLGVTSAYYSHSTGTLLFGDDGTLLFSCGDGAHYDRADAGGLEPNQFLPGRSDPLEDIGAYRSQWTGSLSGKILRLNPANGDGIPSNPFYDAAHPRSSISRIWARGLRNPYRMTIRRGSGSTNPADARPGTLFVGDVGWNRWEEINVCRGGENFGWPCNEGSGEQTDYPYAGVPPRGACPPGGAGLTAPSIEWPHNGLTADSAPIGGIYGNAAAGGAYYQGTGYPIQYRKRLFFCDYPSSWLNMAVLDASDHVVDVQDFGSNLGNPVEIRLDPVSGDFMYCSWASKRILRIHYTGPTGAGVAPVQPTGLRAIPQQAKVLLNWGYNPESDLVGYNVYRTSALGGPEVKLTPVPVVANSFVDDGSVSAIANGLTYTYTIEAVDNEAPPKVSPRSAPAPVIPSSKAWEWYAPLPGPSLALPFAPAHFPLDLAVPNALSVPYNHSPTIDRAPQLRRTDMGAGNWTLETRVTLSSFVSAQLFHSGLMVGFGPYDLFYWGFYRGTNLRLERTGASNLLNVMSAATTLSLRVVKTGSTYSFEYRAADASPWTVAGTQTVGAPVQRVGYITKTWDFDVPVTARLQRLAFNEVPPVAAATAVPAAGSAPLTVQFTDSSYDPDGDVLTDAWAFGDGATSTTASPAHVYQNPGSYTATLTVTDGSGLLGTAPFPIQVVGNFPPQASITAPADGGEYTNPQASLPLVASATDVEDPPSALHYMWTVNLHNGASTTPNYLHPPGVATTSIVPGTAGGANLYLEIILTVTDSQGASARDTALVYDHSLPPAAALELRAAQANGSSAPAVPGAASPWVDLAAGHNAALSGFTTPGAASGWNGGGVVGDPYRLAFDGVDDLARVAAGSIPQLQNPAAATVELWLKTPTDVLTRSYVLEWLSSYGAPFAGMSVALQNGQLQVYNGSWQSIANVAPQRWVHLAVTKSASQVCAYVNGARTLTATPANLGGQASELLLGSGTYGGAGHYSDEFNGALGEVRAYGFALTAGQVAVRLAQSAALYANAPLLTTILPAAATNESNLTGVQLTGDAFVAGATVRLRRAGQPDIVATSVAVAGATQLTCNLPLTGAAPGAWDVVVTNPNGQSGVLAGGFTLSPPPLLAFELRADRANGSTPPAVPGAAGPWVDLVAGRAVGLSGFTSPGAASGWRGQGVRGDPYRLRFDGIDDRATLSAGGLAALQSPTTATVELWLAAGSNLAARQIALEWVQSYASPWPGCAIAVQNDSLRARLVRWVALAPVTAGTFHHVALSYDAAGVRAYVDGALRYSSATTGLGSQVSELVLGGGTSGGAGIYGNFFDGDLGQVRIYRVALDGLAVAASYATGFSTFGPPPPTPVLSLSPAAGALAAAAQSSLDLRYDDLGGGNPLRGVSAEIGYDPAVFSVVSAVKGPFLETTGGATSFFAANTSAPGTIRIDQSLLGATPGAHGFGVLATVTLRVQPGAPEGASALPLTVMGLVDVADPPQSLSAQAVGAARAIDLTPPGAPTALTLLPLHQGVRLGITPPAADFAGLTLFYRPWSLTADAGYPDFDDAVPAPAWPATLTEARAPANGWTELQLDAPLTLPYTVPLPQRTIVSLIALSRDAAGNLSDLASAPRKRATNYRLGDLGDLGAGGQPVPAFDGRVDGAHDLPVLSLTYGLQRGNAAYLGGADIGPTSDATGTGLPLTDGKVDFSDLVVFALNFGLAPAKLGAMPLAVLPQEPDSGPLRIALGEPAFTAPAGGAQPANGSLGGTPASGAPAQVDLPLQIRGNGGALKALHVALEYDRQRLRYLGFRRADVLDVAGAPVFVSDAAGQSAAAGTVVLDLAVLGQGATLRGDGTLLTLQLEVLGELGGALQPREVQALGVDGQTLAIEIAQLARASVVTPPSAFRLLAAIPNPFNPRTTLRFETPVQGFVRLRVFDVAGRLVRNLLAQDLPAGYHAVEWDGHDDRGGFVASGVYLYELAASNFRDVKKALLVK
jgi:glucose/arabinose dehydrogenase/PKD repeat protein